MQQHKANPVSRRLAAISGIGPIGALSFAVRVDPKQFASARHFAAWLGLVPRECSTAGKQRLGGISRAGDERLRRSLVLDDRGHPACQPAGQARGSRANRAAGHLAVAAEPARPQAAQARGGGFGQQSLPRRRPGMARIVWAMMTSGEAYRPRPAAA
jgi:transposase